jgi:glycine dehydrogenase subunit 1
MNHRYIPLTDNDKKLMLDAIGVETINDLFKDIPDQVKFNRLLNLKESLSETELIKEFKRLSNKNANLQEYTSYLGAGVYEHYIPAVVDHMLLRSEFYTAYTPYQPEISQGELQAIFEFQSMICEITGMDVANASMYDGATALAEAAMLAHGHTKKKKILISEAVHPEYRDVVLSYAKGQNVAVEFVRVDNGITCLDSLQEKLNEDIAAVCVQYPNFFGQVEDIEAIKEKFGDLSTLLIVSSNPLSLGVLEAPGYIGADIVVGDTQPFGIPTAFGGPHCGYFAVKSKYMRKVPGRLVGETVDENGLRGYVLTLQAREQHIRRDKATSNICSNQALNALASAICMSALGPNGLQEIAEQNIQKAYYARQQFENAGFEVLYSNDMFNEFVVKLDKSAKEVNKHLFNKGIIGGLEISRYFINKTNEMLICITELRTKSEIDTLVKEMRDYNEQK